MKVTLGKNAGFCYGVKRAVELAEQAAASGKPCVMLGPIIHNEHVISRFKDMGVDCVSSIDEIPEGSTVILRSHGESRAVHEALKSRGAEIMDATCPNVVKIHKIVAEAEQRGRTPVIIGTPEHPEIIAIAGWCHSPVVLDTPEKIETWVTNNPRFRTEPITVVSQTTATKTRWNSCLEKIKKLCTNSEIFDTICNATVNRQSEAQELAANNDIMVVVGDPRSSNTRRLAELCRELCRTVLSIEDAGAIESNALPGAVSVGITAGASTPGWIIKEVYDRMSDEMKEMEIEESFAEMLEKSIKTLNTGEKVTGVVVNITPTEVQVDLGTKHAGYIPLSELTDDPSVKVEDLVKVGDEIETYVMRVNDVEGIVTLSKKRLDSVKNWDEIEKAKEDHTVVEGVVTEENKGGIVVSVRGIRVFVPASQTGLPRDAEMKQLLKSHVRLYITEVNRSRRRLVGSIRAVNAEERAAKSGEIWNNIEAGKRYQGEVKSLTSYGAFVDIGGVDGMVHISELSWSRIKTPSEVVKPGDKVEVYVISFDADKKKISLGMKDRAQNPWEVFTGKYQVGDVASVRVVKLMTFGAFAEVVPGVDGLIHISQIADHRIEKPGDVLSEGQVVEAKITEVDTEKQKISLSIRAVLDDASKGAETDAEAE